MRTVRQPDAPRLAIGGVGISCTDMPGAVDALFRIAGERSGGYVAFTSAHGIVDSQTDEKLRDILNGGRMTMPDGMPLVWVGRLKRRAIGQVTAGDFFERVMRDPRARGIRHFFYGGSPETVQRIAVRATRLVGADAIAGFMSPPPRASGEMEGREVIAEIAATEPHVIWVGLGLPRQEYWMANHARLLPHSLLLGVGAAFDRFAGTQPRAPRVLQAMGMEWMRIFAREVLHR